MSLLRTYLVNESETVDSAYEEYPHHTFVDEKGETKVEPQNKYFINFHEKLPNKSAILNKKLVYYWIVYQ